MMPVADGVPQLNVEQVCEGIVRQGGVTFRDPVIIEVVRSQAQAAAA